MNVFWLEQTEADLPATDEWLSARETRLLLAMRFPKRRADWRLGRWTAKHALSVCLGLSLDPATLAIVEVLAAASGQPEAFVRGRAAQVSLSLSHRAGLAFCAVAQAGIALGCDIEMIEPRSDAFAGDYFSVEEQELISATAARDRPLVVNVLWSAKESAAKALREGLRIDTRSLNVYLESSHQASELWFPLRVYYLAETRFQGCWSRTGNIIRTVVASIPSLRPMPLAQASNVSVSYADIACTREPLP
jgi:4'-phosphopantetheinyl transferase